MWGLYDLLYLWPIYLLFPGVSPLLAAAFLFGGIVYPRIERYRSALIVGIIVIAVLVPFLVAIQTPRWPSDCDAL